MRPKREGHLSEVHDQSCVYDVRGNAIGDARVASSAPGRRGAGEPFGEGSIIGCRQAAQSIGIL